MKVAEPSISRTPVDSNWAPVSHTSIWSFLEDHSGGQTWLRTEHGDLSSREVLAKAADLSEDLAARGIGEGDRVALLAENGAEFVTALFSIIKLKACAVLLPTHLPGDLLAGYLDIAEIGAALIGTGLVHAELSAALGRSEPVADGQLELLVGTPRGERYPAGTTPALMIFTSGTTGLPKAVVFSHRYVLEVSHVLARGKGFEQGERLYLCTPMCHADGVVAMIITLTLGGELAIARKFSRSRFWDDIAKYDSTSFYYVGAILSFLTRSEFGPDGPTSLRFATGGGASQSVAEKFEDRFTVAVLEAYSMTECMACCSNTITHRRPGTVGRPYPGYEVLIVDPDDQVVPKGEAGELLVRPPWPSLTFDEYYGRPLETVQKLRSTWFRTGDVAVMDDEGYLLFRGRQGEAIRRRGENILPTHVETAAQALPAVRRAAAAGLASEHGDQDILLLIELADGQVVPPTLAAELVAALPHSMRPRWIRVVDTIPITATNKIRRSELAGVVPVMHVEVPENGDIGMENWHVTQA